MKKVAFCLRDMQLGGVESVLIRTLDHLIEDKNLEITVVTYVGVREPVFVEWFNAHPSVHRIVLYPSKFFGTKMPRFFLWRIIKHFGRDIYRGVRRFFCVKNKLSGFDTVIDYHDFGFADEFSKINVSKKVAWFHSSLNVFIKRKFVNRLKFYDKVVVLTDDCVSDLKKKCSQYADKFIRIYNPVDIKNIKEKADEKSKIVGDYFCCVARMSYDKDIKTVLDAFDRFWAKNKKVKLVLVGGGNKTNVFKHYASGLKSVKNILFVGTQNNPYVYMKNAKANILSSYGEGFALILVESAIVRTLNIASDCKYGPREILMDGKGGLLFEPGNVDQLVQCMMDVYNKNVDVKNMIDESTKALKRFNSKIIMRQVKSQIS